ISWQSLFNNIGNFGGDSSSLRYGLFFVFLLWFFRSRRNGLFYGGNDSWFGFNFSWEWSRNFRLLSLTSSSIQGESFLDNIGNFSGNNSLLLDLLSNRCCSSVGLNWGRFGEHFVSRDRLWYILRLSLTGSGFQWESF